MECMRGTAAPIGAGPPAGVTGGFAQEGSLPMEHLQGTAAPIGVGPPAGGTGRPA